WTGQEAARLSLQWSASKSPPVGQAPPANPPAPRHHPSAPRRAGSACQPNCNFVTANPPSISPQSSPRLPPHHPTPLQTGPESVSIRSLVVGLPGRGRLPFLHSGLHSAERHLPLKDSAPHERTRRTQDFDPHR